MMRAVFVLLGVCLTSPWTYADDSWKQPLEESK